MSPRRKPFETGNTSRVIYPSDLFALEKDEVYPYERFAYNVLHIGIEALHVRGLPESIVVDFTQLLPRSSPWSINASISVERDHRGHPVSFRIVTPELAPAIFYMFTVVVASALFSDEGFESFKKDPQNLGRVVQQFVDGASAGIRAFREKGLGAAVRASYEALNLSIPDLIRCGDDYDLFTKQIAYHEIAHAYVGQFTHQQTLTSLQKRAFELIADMVATEWFYNGIVRNTPDSEEYRNYRGVATHAEAIMGNAILAMRSQHAYLVLSALAGAQRTGGPVSLASGESHPPGLQRCMLQHVHLHTLIASNFSNVLSPGQRETIDRDWDERMDVLFASGILPKKDVEASIDESTFDTIDTAADLIRQQKVPELLKVVEFLPAIRTLLNNLRTDKQS